MKSLIVGELQKPVGSIVLGGIFGERSDAQSFRILDRFLELGGNAIETAHAYGQGAAEEQIGRWLNHHDQRSRVVLITKVCHPHSGEVPSMATFDKELDLSLARLGVDTVDIVLTHRDPVGTPIIDILRTLERRRTEGSIRTYGISNITGERLQSFDRAAEELCISPLALISNYFGFAQQARPPWYGSVQLDEMGQRWLRLHDRPLLCWSALAQGWFARRELPDNFRSVYDTPANRSRRLRADRLAARLGVSSLQVALAYTFAAPFSILASVGPRSTEELDEIFGSLSVPLSEADCAFLVNSSC